MIEGWNIPIFDCSERFTGFGKRDKYHFRPDVGTANEFAELLHDIAEVLRNMDWFRTYVKPLDFGRRPQLWEESFPDEVSFEGGANRVRALRQHFEPTMSAPPVPVRPPGMQPMMPPIPIAQLPAGVLVGNDPTPPPPPVGPPPPTAEAVQVPDPPEPSPEPDPPTVSEAVASEATARAPSPVRAPNQSFSWNASEGAYRIHATPAVPGGWSLMPPVPPCPSAEPPHGLQAFLRERATQTAPDGSTGAAPEGPHVEHDADVSRPPHDGQGGTDARSPVQRAFNPSPGGPWPLSSPIEIHSEAPASALASAEAASSRSSPLGGSEAGRPRGSAEAQASAA